MASAPSSTRKGLGLDGLRPDRTQPVSLSPNTLVIAGWAGRDPDAIEAHIRELEEIGVARPRSIPTFYRVAASLLTQEPTIDVVGTGSSGEVEVALLHGEDGLWIALGSDHTDRKLEAVGVTLSKQVCPKPLGTTCWKLDDLRDHWDRLTLRSTIRIDGEVQLYQEGPIASLRHPESLLEEYRAAGNAFPVGSVMFCGTVPVEGGLRFADEVMLELVDPVLNRALRHEYAVRALEIVD